MLGGLIGLCGAEFRLPALVSIFNYRTLQAIIINLIVSLVTVTFSFIFRSGVIGLENVAANWVAIINILAGSNFIFSVESLQLPSLLRTALDFWREL